MRRILAVLVFTVGCNGQGTESHTRPQAAEADVASPQPSERLATLLARPVPEPGTKTSLTEADFRTLLSPEEFYVLREKGTERAFSGEYNKAKSDGVYHCRACNAPLFSSATKFDSRTGWPSYFEPIAGRVDTAPDTSHGMERTEVLCAHCGSHLGHVFDDGPEPTGLRYCVNSLSLVLEEK